MGILPNLDKRNTKQKKILSKITFVDLDYLITR